jgi:hypothetical protein
MESCDLPAKLVNVKNREKWQNMQLHVFWAKRMIPDQNV